MKKKKFFLIGGAGFIGKNLAIELVKCGHKVTIYDCVDNPFENGFLDIAYVKGNYFDNDIGEMLLKQQDIVILLACSVGPKSSMINSESCYSQDIVTMIKLLDQLRSFNISRLVFISSGGTVYGRNNEKALSEEMQTFPINHYGILKLTQEKIILMYNDLYKMNNVIFRIANPYGPGQRIASGIGAVTVFLDNIIHEKEISLFGKGDIVRDYIYIEDVAKMITNFLEKEIITDNIPIYNVGTGSGYTLLQVIEVIEKVIGKKAKVSFRDEREIDVKRNVLDIQKLLSVIGDYKCKSLLEGVTEFYYKLRR